MREQLKRVVCCDRGQIRHHRNPEGGGAFGEHGTPAGVTSINLRRVNRKQAEKGRSERLQRLARRNRDVAWLMAEHQKLAAPKPTKKPTAK